MRPQAETAPSDVPRHIPEQDFPSQIKSDDDEAAGPSLLLLSQASPCLWLNRLRALACCEKAHIRQVMGVEQAIAGEEICFADVVLLASDHEPAEAAVEQCLQLLQACQERAMSAPVLVLGLSQETHRAAELLAAGVWELVPAEISDLALEQALQRALRHAQRQAQCRRLGSSCERTQRSLLQFFNDAPVGLALFNSDGLLTAANASAERIMGVASNAAVGVYNHLNDPEARRTGSAEALQRALQGEVVCRERICLHTGRTSLQGKGAGRKLWARSRFFPVGGSESASAPLAGCMFEDIESDVRQEQRREMQQQRLRMAQKIAGIGYWEVHFHSGEVYWSEACCELLGLEPHKEPHSLEQLRRLLQPEDGEAFSRSMADLAVFTRPLDMELTITRPDGQQRVLRCLGESVKKDAGVVLHGALQDVTEVRRDAARLQQAHALLQTILDTMPSPLFFKDLAGRYAMVNNAFAELHGRPKSEILGKTVRDLTPGEYSETYELMDQAILQSKGACVQRYEFPVRYADGNVGAMLFHKGPVFDEQGEIMGLVCIMNDVTERTRHMAELRLRFAFEEFLSSLSTSFLTMGTEQTDKGVELTLARTVGFFRAQRALVLQRDTTGRTVTCTHEWRAPHVDSICRYFQDLPETNMDWALGMVERNHELLVQDIEALPTEAVQCKLRLREQGVRAFAAAPLLLNGEVVGCIRLDRLDELAPWKPETAARLRQVANILSNALQRARSEERLRKTMEAAERATLAKSDFLATMSHELRTPMNGIIGLAQLLMDSETDDVRREDLQTLHDAAQSLLFLLNDILDFSKIEAGKMQLEIRPCHLPELLESVARVFGVQAERAGLTFTLQIAQNIPTTVRTDPDRLRQILNNLLHNALKFTTEGSVRLFATPVPGTKDMLRFVVEDTGVGIAPEQLPNIFERFSQADGHAARRLQGTGLGLAICKRLCTMLGGDISVQSEPGTGSAFTFTTRAPEAKQGRSTKQRQQSSEQAMERPLCVLVAEDNDVNRKVVCGILESRGHHAVCVCNGLEVLEKLDQQPFDLVLMDIMMPEMDGTRCTQSIRSGSFSHNSSDLPVIACTAHAMRGDKEQFLQAGMNGYVSKPIMPESLFVEIAAVLQGRGLQGAQGTDAGQDPQETQAASSVGFEADTVLDLEDVFNRVEGDSQLMRTVFEDFLERSDAKLLELEETLALGDCVQLARLSHALKGSCGTLGLRRAQQAAANLERAMRERDMKQGLELYRRLQQELKTAQQAVRQFLQQSD